MACVLFAGCASVDSPLSPRGLTRRMYLGPTLGFSVNTPTGNFHSQSPQQPDCGGFTGGSGTGAIVGLVFDYWFQQKLSSNGIVARILFEQTPGTFTADYGSVPILNPYTRSPEQVPETHVADVSNSLINARIAYLYSIPSTAIGIEFGPSVGITSKLHIMQHLHIDQSAAPDVSFGNNSSDSTVYDADPSSKSGVRFGLWAGAQYKFDVGWWIIAPYAGFDVGLTKVLTTDSWSISNLVAGVDVKYGIK